MNALNDPDGKRCKKGKQGMNISPCVKRISITIVMVKHVINHLINVINKASEFHTFLRKMAKFVSNYRLQFADRKHIYQGEADLKIFSYRKKHTPEITVIKNAGIHFRREIDFFRKTGLGILAKFTNELE